MEKVSTTMPENETKPVAQGWLATRDPAKIADVLAQMPADSEHRRYGNDDPYFALYLYLADRKCTRAIGLSIFDLADHTWHDAYTDGSTPSQAVRDALAGDDTYSSIFGGE
jgi:hypothetical protein